jgi:hypothetical protein
LFRSLESPWSIHQGEKAKFLGLALCCPENNWVLSGREKWLKMRHFEQSFKILLLSSPGYLDKAA